MSDPEYRPTYAKMPWVIPPAPAVTEAVFVKEGEPFEVPRGDFFDFGRGDTVWWIESGLFATYSKNYVRAMRYIGLFGPRTVLGGTMAVRSRGDPMQLAARVLAKARGLRLGAKRSRRLLEEPGTASLMFRWCLSASEAQLEGSVVNDLYPVEMRMRLALAALYAASGGNPAEASFPVDLPWEITVTDIARLVHADRSLVSRILSDCQRKELLSKSGRRIAVRRNPLSGEDGQS